MDLSTVTVILNIVLLMPIVGIVWLAFSTYKTMTSETAK